MIKHAQSHNRLVLPIKNKETYVYGDQLTLMNPLLMNNFSWKQHIFQLSQSLTLFIATNTMQSPNNALSKLPKSQTSQCSQLMFLPHAQHFPQTFS